MQTNTNALVRPAQESSGEVSREYEVMSKNLESLRSLVGDLESRLSPVLAARAEDAQAGSSQPEPVRVPLAQNLYLANVAMVEQEARIRSILSRIEL